MQFFKISNQEYKTKGVTWQASFLYEKASLSFVSFMPAFEAQIQACTVNMRDSLWLPYRQLILKLLPVR